MLENMPEALGHALRDRRAGLDTLVFNRCGLRTGHGRIRVSSLAFADHAPMPARYTADGDGLSPPLLWSDVPADASELVLIVEDADAPTSDPLVHAIVVELPVGDGGLPEGAITGGGHEGEHMHEGRNSTLRKGWLPPDPPPGHGDHRYAFQLYALGPGTPFKGAPGRGEVLAAVQERGIASGLLIGTYARPDGTVKDEEPGTAALPGMQPAT